MDTKLSQLFQASRGAPIEWHGRHVYAIYELAGLNAGYVLLIEFVDVTPARPQALRLDARGGSIGPIVALLMLLSP